MLRSPRRRQRGKSQSTVQLPADDNTVPAIRGGELQAAAETHRGARPKPPPRRLPQLCQEDLQEEQVRGAEARHRFQPDTFVTLIMTRV